jgi:uncharacterized membrane protein SpoIIM required for sporulation
MREPAFINQNAEKWKRFEALLQKRDTASPDEQADLFIQLTDDLSYARTFYPQSKVAGYLNHLTGSIHQAIYRNKREDTGRIGRFWRYELPLLMYEVRRELLISLLIFGASALIGALSAANDDSFVRLILGDSYVNMTLDNIDKNDPMAVYKKANEVDMFLGITLNNIWVSFYTFIYGVIFSIGTAYILLQNGIMLGAFQYFFYEKGLFLTSFLTIWIHGTLEISAIVIAGAAGLTMGNSLLFPETYTRAESFKQGAKKGLKIIIGLIPIFITAGFLEGFVTRHTEMPNWAKITIIGTSFAFILYYFAIYPTLLRKNQAVLNYLAQQD